jgi:hypothetical protein
MDPFRTASKLALHLTIAAPVISALGASGCALSAPSHPWADVSDPAAEGEARRRAVAESTARRDLECTETKVTVALHPATGEDSTWQPLLQPQSGRARYVVEGCGKRGLYIESCTYIEDFTAVTEDLSPRDGPSARTYECRYLLVSMVPDAAHHASHSSESGNPSGAVRAAPASLAVPAAPEEEDDTPDADGGPGGALGL